MVCPPRAAVLGSRTRVDAYNRSITTPLTGEPDAGDPPVRFGGRGKVQSLVPTPIGAPVAGPASFVCLVLLAGCTVGSDYKRPEAMAMPAAYAGATNGWKVAQPQAQFLKGTWWEIFGDAELNGLESQAYAANQQLKTAAMEMEVLGDDTGVPRASRSGHKAGDEVRKDPRQEQFAPSFHRAQAKHVANLLEVGRDGRCAGDDVEEGRKS